MWHLGELYCGNFTGEGMDDHKAAEWYAKGAQAGNVNAMSSLAYMYKSGTGVPRNPQEAAAWYKKAAEGGDQHAYHRLGEMYVQGQGIPQNFHQAYTCFSAAAEAGWPFSMYALGELYELGRGVKRDYAIAGNWYEKAQITPCKELREQAKQAQERVRTLLASGE